MLPRILCPDGFPIVACCDPPLEPSSQTMTHCCSPFGASAHISGQNLLTFRVIYQLQPTMFTEEPAYPLQMARQSYRSMFSGRISCSRPVSLLSYGRFCS